MPLVPKKPMIRRSERVRARSTCKAESRGHCHQIGERVSLHLSHHLTPVCLYCDLADVELATDLFIQQAGGYQRHDLPFARSERRVTVPERPYLRLATKCGRAASYLTFLFQASMVSIRSLAMRFCRSRPLRPGRETSSMRQLGTRTRGRLRNSCADANISGCQPSQRINNSSDSRTETSSSTTNTIGVPSDMGDNPTSWPSARAKFILYPPGAAHSRSPNSLEVRH